MSFMTRFCISLVISALVPALFIDAVTHDRGGCATDALISALPCLVEHAKAPQAGLSRIDDAAADAIGGEGGRIQTRGRTAADERHVCAGQIGISGERIRDL